MVKKKVATKNPLKKLKLPPVRTPTTADDVKTAILLVSITINVAVFVGWLAIKITTQYDAQVAEFLFSR
jgi:hypothetical protein